MFDRINMFSGLAPPREVNSFANVSKFLRQKNRKKNCRTRSHSVTVINEGFEKYYIEKALVL